LLFVFPPIKFNILSQNCKLNGSSALFFGTPFKFQLDYLLVYADMPIENWKISKLLECFLLTIIYHPVKSSSLIWGFAIYFVIWHSIPSIIDQIKFLNGSFSFPHFITYCKNAGFYWLLLL
jgi:hypothetical protein